MDVKFQITLEACRVNKKLTQAEMAERLGVTQNTIFNWENGKSEPSASQLRNISSITGVPMEYIFFPNQSKNIELR